MEYQYILNIIVIFFFTSTHWKISSIGAFLHNSFLGRIKSHRGPDVARGPWFGNPWSSRKLVSSEKGAFFVTCLLLATCLTYFCTLKMEGVYSSEASVNIYQATRRYVPEDSGHLKPLSL
jgi:hypothetical protein